MSRMTWYLMRLQSMSAGEVIHRLGEMARVKSEKFAFTHADNKKNVFCLPAEAYSSFTFDKGHLFYWTWEARAALQEVIATDFSRGEEATLHTADELLEHRFKIFDRVVDYSGEINWHADPLTGREWPRSFWADIDIRDGEKIGGVKWVWELNRHHHLVSLGKAYFLSGDERYAQEVCRQMVGWIEENPYRVGVNWTSSLEMAVRIVNWGWALSFIRRSISLTPEVFARVMASIDEQARQIEAHPSMYSSANNHRIGEAAGLAFTGMLFPWLPQALAWRVTGIRCLSREIEKQISPEGVPAEQAVDYLAFISDFFLMIGILAKKNHIDLPRVWYDRLSAAGHFIAQMAGPKGDIVQIGDSDNALVVRLDDGAEAQRFRSILSSAAVFLDAPQRWTKANDWDETCHWLLGGEGRSKFLAKPEADLPAASIILPESGYAILNGLGVKCIFDFGPLGYLSTAAHGHADALSVWLTLDGRPFLVDSGTYAYHEGGAWRSYFRSTYAHNTLVVDDEDQSQMAGTFLWGLKARSRLHSYQTTPEVDFVTASHDGYRGKKILHLRTIVFLKPHNLFIVDEVTGSGDHSIRQLWHFPAEAQIENSPGCVKVNSGSSSAHFYRLDDLAARATVYQGNENPIQGWVSPKYGVKVPAPVLEYRHQGTLPVKLVSAVDLSPSVDAGHFESLKARFYEIYTSLSKVN